MLKECSGGGVASVATATTAGVRLFKGDKRINYIRLSNLGEDYVYVTPANGDTNQAEMNKGIVLAPKGEHGWFIEFNRTNMIHCDFWAVASSSCQVAVFLGM